MEQLAISWVEVWDLARPISWTESWKLIAWGNDKLRNVAYYATIITFLGVMYNLFSHWYSWRRVKIIVVNAGSPRERRVIGDLPRKSVTRAEVMGFVSQAAGGATLNFRKFKFDYDFRRKVEVMLPDESYRAVVDRPRVEAFAAAA